MKKYIALLLVCVTVFSLCACSSKAPEATPSPVETAAPEADLEVAEATSETAGPSPETLKAEASPTPTEEVKESVSLDALMADFATDIQAGSAGSSLKAVKQAVRLMDWGTTTKMTTDEIFKTVEKFYSGLDAAAAAEYNEQIGLLLSTYETLLTEGQEDLLESAGCTGTAYLWGGEPIPAVEAFFEATGIRKAGIYTGDYADFLETYYTAISEQWSIEKVAMAGMNIKTCELFTLPDALDRFGFTVRDINSDGVEELLVGLVNDMKAVNDMYTYVDGNRTLVIQGGDYNDKYYSCNEGTIARYTHKSDANWGYHYYTLKNGWLVPFGCIIYNTSYNPKNFWYAGVDDDWDVSNDTVFPPDWAMQKVESYEVKYVDNAYTPFSELH